jgi:ABC-type amino acid transport substrate-binding protein
MEIVRKILLLFLSIFFFISATATATDEKTIIGAEDSAGLWGMKDGTGCGNDIVAAAFKAANFPVTFEVLPYIRAKKEVIEGKLPGCFGMAWESSLKDKVVFADQPLYTVTTVVVVKKDDSVTKMEDLKAGMVVGTVRGYEYTTEFNALPKKGIVLKDAKSETQNLEKLLLGRVDAAILNIDELKSLEYLLTSSKMLKSADAAGKIRQAFIVDSYGTYVGFSTINKKGLIAKHAFDKGYTIIKNNGTYDRIFSEWKKRQ